MPYPVAAARGFRTVRPVAAARSAYRLLATFNAANQALADGQLLTTVANGVSAGRLRVVEKDGTAEILNNALRLTGGSTASMIDLGVYGVDAITRTLGVTLGVTIVPSTGWQFVSWHDTAGEIGGYTAAEYTAWLRPTELWVYADSQAGAIVAAVAAATNYQLRLVLGGYNSSNEPWRSGAAGTFSQGCALFIKGGAFTNWSLVWRWFTGTDASLYPIISRYHNTITLDVDVFMVPDHDYSAVLQPTHLDLFTGADDDLLAAHSPEVGGSWTVRTGVFDIQSSRAAIDTASGGRDVATVTAGVADCMIDVVVRKTDANDTGEMGICLRYSNDSNYWLVVADFANNLIKIIERNAGTETLRASASVALVTGTDYHVRTVAVGNNIQAYLNGANRCTYASASLNNTATLHGIVGNGAAQTWDNFAIYPRTSTAYDELDTLDGTDYVAEVGALTIQEPSAYQVIQRNGSNQADIRISGHYYGTPTAIEASFNGGAYATIDAAPSGGRFTGTLTAQSAGQGTLTVRFANDTSKATTVQYVGVGDVFVIAGQSNAVGQVINLQSYSHPTLKAGMFRPDYRWYELADPIALDTGIVDTVAYNSGYTLGTYWQAVATFIMADQNVPVAFVPCAKLSTGIITHWQASANPRDTSTLFGSMNVRAATLGGVKAVLWHQGESDALSSMAEATYNAALDTLAGDIATNMNCSIMPCKLQRNGMLADANEDRINNAIGTAWSDNANVLAGPDLTGISVAALHIESDVDCATAAGLWWTAIKAAFYP